MRFRLRALSSPPGRSIADPKMGALAHALILAGVAAALSFFVFTPNLKATSKAEMLQQAQQLIQRGDLTAARTQLSQALRTFPQDPGLLNLLGVVEAQQGNYKAAEAAFQRAIGGAPDFTGAYLNLGRLYQEAASKDPAALKKGADTYERLLKFEPNNTEANYQSAFLLARLGSFRVSLERLSRLPAAAQERPQALAVRCADYAGLKECARAEDAAGRLLKHPDLTESDVVSILPALADRRCGDLVPRLLEGLDNRQLASAKTLYELALSYEQRGKLDRARATLERIAQREPISVPLLTKLARVADQQGDHEGTLGYLAHARDLEPNNPAIHFFFGMVCVEMNLAEEAYRSLKKAVTLNPGNPYYNYALGSVMTSRRDVRESYPYFRKYCELKPQDPRGRLALGIAYFYGHDPELARQELEAVANYRETAPGAHFFLGRLANREGKFSEAVQELQKALEANPQYADPYAELGLVYLKQKEYAEAEKALLKAVEIDPESYLANLNLMALYQRTRNPRADAQVKRFEEIKKKREERSREFMRTIEVRP